MKDIRMQYVNLGRTGLKVSRICLGMMTYGSSQWRPWVLDEEAARPFVRRAVELGINFFDTANMYSNGASETLTGKLLRECMRREEMVIATKAYFPMFEQMQTIAGAASPAQTPWPNHSCRARGRGRRAGGAARARRGAGGGDRY